ncbi:hypothetical protein JCGZ_21915 [Jatropha curcas]|uniref:PHD-type domain-containing protein n=1 Tax=Jatropha curcas TaxID=180498 RepID=A0A067JPH5_JATCU|nr:uncharacterized protein LOC105649979 [Jatropha curcas]KDP21444.1 hypothetical protein JCGZ_21915 [Jatropha curcas]
MREGLRSGFKLLAKTEKGEVWPSQETVTMEVGSNEEEVCGLTDENVAELVASGTEEEKLVSAPKEGTETDEVGGLKYEDFGADDDIGEDELVELTHNRKESSRLEGLVENGVGSVSVKKQKVKGEVAGGKLQVVGRVLRSGSTVKPEGEDKVVTGQSNGVFIGEKTGGKDGSEEKRVTMKEEEGDHLNGEDTFQSGNIVSGELVRKRGRPPKTLQREFQKQCDDVEKGEIDQSAARKTKRKRGRPPKARENDESQKKQGDHIEESEDKQGDDRHNKQNEEIKKLNRKRGRPPKAQKNDESQKKLGEMVKEEIKLSVCQENHQPNDEEFKKLKPRRGRPPKAQKSSLFEKKKAKREEEEGAECAVEDSDQPNTQAKETLRHKLGRPPKAQKCDGSLKKMVQVANEVIDQSADNDSEESYGKVRKKLEPNYGNKLNNSGKVGLLRKYRKGATSKHKVQVMNQNAGNRSSLSGKRFLGKECNVNILPAKKMKCNNYEDGGKPKMNAGEMGHGRSARQAVRDKIVELLLDAGWEIQHRPRHGREYMDAVYVNPEGRTHWSVTLAYRVLKKHYEDSSDNLKPGFKFTPIPDEELKVLTKVMHKVRSDKNKKKKKWNQEEKDEKMIEVTKKKKWKKMHKRKLGVAAGVGYKMMKGRKPKPLLRKQDESAVTSGQGNAVSVRSRKRLEMHGRTRCALMVRNSQEGTESDSDGYVLYSGKRTVLGWMLGLGIVPLDEKVQYLKRRKTRGALKGRITTDGIQCDCCNKTFTIAEFEIHAGGKSSQPFKNICLDTGSSLLQCQLDSWHKQDESALKGFHFIDIAGEDPNDDTCGICGDGGDLICCDSCPSTFHQSCLEIKMFPSGSWHCVFCLCKFCGETGGNTCQIDDNNATLLCALLTCHLCEEKYHKSCVQVKEGVSDDPVSSSFCGKKCQELYERLQMLFGVKHELEEGFSWTFVRRFDVGSDISLSGMPRKVECNSKVAVALHIMDECFLPMVDHRSGVNLIRNIVYNFGSNFNRLNYSGFFTAILERGDEMIAAASIRIHGNHLAEMPFIGTRYAYRRQGMCRRLLSAIETALCSLNVEKLVIPAISELRKTWTSVFGFKPLEGSSKQKLSNMNMMVFPGVDMLQKPLLKHQFAGKKMNLIEGSESTELGELHTKEDLENKFDERCSAGSDLKGSLGAGLPCSGNIIKELAAVDAGSLVPGERNESISSPFDLSCNACEKTGDESMKNINEKCSAGFEFKASSDTGVAHASTIICEPAEVESGSLPPDGCLNDRSDMTIQDMNSTKCHVHSGGTFDSIDGRNENTVNTLDSLCDSHEQTENEMIKNYEEGDSAGVDFKDYCTTKVSNTGKISQESSAAELDSISDGYLNDTSDTTPHDANDIQSHYQCDGISNGVDGKTENIVNPLDSSCGAFGQAARRNGQQKALSAATGLPTDNAVPQLHVQLNQHNVSAVDIKLCAISHTVSGAAICGGELTCGSNDSTEAISFEVKTKDNNVKHNANTLGKDHMHITAEIIGTQSQDLIFERVKGSDKDAVFLESNKSNNGNISSDVVQSTSPAACQREGDFAALPSEQNFRPCKSNGPTCDDLCHAVASDITTGSNLQASTSNVPCMTINVAPGSCVGGVCDPKIVSAAAQSNSISLDEGLISDGAHVNAELSKLPLPHSDVDHASMMPNNSESLCSACSTPGVVLYCASGAGNSSNAPEVMILSNQAN